MSILSVCLSSPNLQKHGEQAGEGDTSLKATLPARHSVETRQRPAFRRIGFVGRADARTGLESRRKRRANRGMLLTGWLGGR